MRAVFGCRSVHDTVALYSGLSDGDMVCPWSGKGDTPDISMWELSNIDLEWGGVLLFPCTEGLLNVKSIWKAELSHGSLAPMLKNIRATCHT